ncbi:unnamed protein product [Parnassius apollo]|uniref:(apollo) hypothetical protein n=1 Tax=Parnassius apollo TaxID=110799 RepID=A0A8S3XJ86_PARAO|nr:unnamed protein product [Parnassius apollo]
MAFAGINISLSQPDITQKLTERIDDLKQIRRFTESSRRFNQNRLFESDQKRLYKSLERPEVCGEGPGPDQAVAFWRGLWSERARKQQRGPLDGSCGKPECNCYDPVTIPPETWLKRSVGPRTGKVWGLTGCIITG